jgi:hypothetical protein
MDADLAELLGAGAVMGTAEVLAVLSGIIRGEGLDIGQSGAASEPKTVWPTHGNILSAIDMYFKYWSRFLVGAGNCPQGAEAGGWFRDEEAFESRGV